MAKSIAEGLTSDHVLRAMADIDRGVMHKFGPPVRYEVLHDGKRYPPKAVVALAIKHASGRSLGPDDFSAGQAPGQANYILRKLGFTVINKDDVVGSANSYVTSRSSQLPTNAEAMAGNLWFNIWQMRLWPYEDLQVGDLLWWYDSRRHAIVWQSRVVRVERFAFTNKREVKNRLLALFDVDVSHDKYFKTASSRGYCVAYQVDSVVSCNIAKPATYRLPQVGWVRGTDAQDWLGIMSAGLLALDGPATTDLSHTAEIVDDSGYFEPSSLKDERERKLREIVTRRGQPEFRNRLITAYGGKCAITDCDAVAALEAAHIVPYCGPDSNHVTNGLLLRADLHTLFDLDLIGIDPATGMISVAPAIKQSSYGELQGRQLRTASTSSATPDPEALGQRWRRFAATD